MVVNYEHSVAKPAYINEKETKEKKTRKNEHPIYNNLKRERLYNIKLNPNTQD